MPVIPFGEWTPDLPAHLNEGATQLLNGMPMARGYEGWASSRPITKFGLDSRAKGMASFVDEAFGAFNFAGDAAKLYRAAVVADVLQYVDESKGGGYSLAQDDLWQFVKYKDLVIAVGRYENPQQFDIATVPATFTDLSATAPQGAHAAIVRDFVVLGNIFDAGDGDRPDRIAWGPIGNPTGIWTPALNTLAGHRDLGGEGGHVMAVLGGEFGVVFQERAVWRMTAVGPPTKFQLDEVEKQQGTPAPRSCVKYRNMFYYMGQDGFYVTTGGGQSVPIGKNRIDDFVLDDLDPNQRRLVVAHADPNKQRIYWIYAGSDAIGGTPNKLVAYDVPNNRWGQAMMNENGFGGGMAGIDYIGDYRTEGFNMDSMDGQFPNLDLVTPSLDDPFWAGGTIRLAGFRGEDLFWLMGWTNPALDATIASGQIQPFEGRRGLVQNLRPLVDCPSATGITANIAGKTAVNDSTTYQAVETTIDAEGNCPLLQEGRYFRARMKLEGDYKHAMGFDADRAVDDGEY